MSKKKVKLKLSRIAEVEYNEVERDIQKCWNFVKQAQYLKAYKHSSLTAKKYKNNRFAIYNFAVALGDSGEWVSEKQHLINQKKAAKILFNLLFRVRGIDYRYVKVFRNEYYWFSKQPYKQYRLGIEAVARLKSKKHYYSSGVGAASIAILKYKAKKPNQGKAWAKKAINAWDEYFTEDSGYYNPYVWYAKALGLSGDLDGMEKALKKAAKLSKRPLSYQEFTRARKEVLSLVKK